MSSDEFGQNAECCRSVRSFKTYFSSTFQSETCNLIIPELELEMGSHALGGKFTTLEGLLKNVQDQIEQNPFYCGALASGDSAIDEDKQRFSTFKERLNQMIEGEDLPFTVILDDPCGNSYLQVTTLATNQLYPQVGG